MCSRCSPNDGTTSSRGVNWKTGAKYRNSFLGSLATPQRPYYLICAIEFVPNNIEQIFFRETLLQGNNRNFASKPSTSTYVRAWDLPDPATFGVQVPQLITVHFPLPCSPPLAWLSLCFQLTPPSPLPLLNITLTRSPRRSTPILYFSTPRFYSYRVRIQISSFPIWKCRITTYLLRLRRLVVPALTLHVLCSTHLFHDRYISGSSCIVTLLI